MARLGDVCFKITDGSHNPPQGVSASEYLMLSSKNIFDDVITFDDPRYLSKEDFELENKRTQIATGDILMTIVGTVGRAAVVPDLAHNICLQRSVAVLKPKSEIVLPRFLMYQLQSMRTKMEKEAKGVAQKGIYLKQVEDLPIRVLSMDEQTGIVSSLDKVSNLLSFRKQQLAKLDELVKSRFIELFGDPMTNSNSYVLKKYGDLFELNAGGTPSKQKPEYWENGTISWIGSNMCQNTIIYENDGNYITEEGLKHSSARMFPVDTVLIALVGATIGKTALLKFETTTNQNVLGVRGIRESGYTPEFVFHYTQGLYQKFLNIGDGGFAMASKGFISELPMPVIDLALQKQFSVFVEQTNKSKLVVQQSIDQLETLKKSLMQKYFG